MRWLDGITNSMDMGLSKLRATVKGREAWHAANSWHFKESDMTQWLNNRLQPTRLLCPWSFPGKNTGACCRFPTPGDLPDPGMKPMSLASPPLAGRFSTTSTTWEVQSLMSNYIRPKPRSQTDLAGNPRYFAYNCLTPKFLNSDLVSLSFGYLSLVWNNGVNLQLQ